ncbi:hypothetical protein FIBSPDRAFT_870376 [Athelia psychrophila]|uniref:Uncharacterized protein n=1 Tax=Athelia psychrophila TaxID=1759441 RepID=A0A166B6D6_9AGAM|nr:hypothetical protein FIBSPDRAFT_870376 [Fibularhizoctonia sp. CBS 109695]
MSYHLRQRGLTALAPLILHICAAYVFLCIGVFITRCSDLPSLARSARLACRHACR